MSKIQIVGAGMAGLSAAIRLAKMGIPSNLVSSQASERAQSVLAEGGINAALDTMGEGDSVQLHYEDTVKGGVYLADPNAVRSLTEHAPETVRMLLSIGTPFEQKGGRLMLRAFGGQSKRRTAYAKSSTGKVIMSALIDEARKYEAEGLIERFPHHDVKEILCVDGSCRGIHIVDRYTKEHKILSGPVLLCIGGMNGLFPGMTTGTVNNTAELTAGLYAQGIKFANLEFIQYHPTTVGISGKRMLISEAARGEGGRLWIQRGSGKYYFMEERYPSLGNLMPRDVVSAEMEAVVKEEDTKGPVYLDLTGLSREVFQTKLSDMREELLEYKGIDIMKEPVAVKPGIHFFMGGILVDEKHRACVPGLYAAGECACQYHGANRLGGNSMLAAVFGGSVAAETAAAEFSVETKAETLPVNDADLTDTGYRMFPPKEAETIREILLLGLGIVRSEEGMNEALMKLEEYEKTDFAVRYSKAETEAIKNRILLGRAILTSAYSRKESRGAHRRSDYPDTDEAYHKTGVAYYDGSKHHVEYAEIAGERTYEHTS